MPREKYTRCRNCGRAKKDVGVMSRNQLCPKCSEELLIDNIRQMEARSGENFQAWRRGMTKASGGYTRQEVEAILAAGHF